MRPLALHCSILSLIGPVAAVTHPAGVPSISSILQHLQSSPGGACVCLPLPSYCNPKTVILRPSLNRSASSALHYPLSSDIK